MEMYFFLNMFLFDTYEGSLPKKSDFLKIFEQYEKIWNKRFSEKINAFILLRHVFTICTC